VQVQVESLQSVIQRLEVQTMADQAQQGPQHVPLLQLPNELLAIIVDMTVAGDDKASFAALFHSCRALHSSPALLSRMTKLPVFFNDYAQQNYRSVTTQVNGNKNNPNAMRVFRSDGLLCCILCSDVVCNTPEQYKHDEDQLNEDLANCFAPHIL